MDWPLILIFFKYVKCTKKISYIYLLIDCLKSVFIFNISPLEYFQFRFFEKSKIERQTWAGTGFMYETILKLNPISQRLVLSDKSIFLKHYKDFIRHSSIPLIELKKYPLNQRFSDLLPTTKLVLKNSFGQCGRGIEFIENHNLTVNDIIQKLENGSNDLVEEFVEQHEALQKMSPSGLNTLRLITIINEIGEVEFLGARLRITIDSKIDNLAAGNIAAPVDLLTGLVSGPGVYSDITKNNVYVHPISFVKLIGFKIPFFKESLELVAKAAKFNKGNRSIGWDVAITNSGPDLIEGNHDWCKLLWQLPVNKGLKSELSKYV